MPKISRKRTRGAALPVRRKRRKMTTAKVREIVKDTVEKSEPHVHRVVNVLGTGYVDGSDTNASLMLIAAGTTAATRVGFKIRVARIYIKLRMQLDVHPTSQTAPMTIRIVLDSVKQGVVAAATGVSARSWFGRPDYNSVTRRVLFDKTFVARQAGDGDQAGPIITYSKMITLKNHEVRWLGSSGVEPLTGNILMAAFAECPTTATQPLLLESEANVYFAEV